ncbi:MAG TPA: MmcQ/YjbR family DNA-binding protein [Gemmatimonadaceae bacterium]|nr:MmcQ/YjbR family DNA-binding protein [Gemmatimonadaceae bacterium]
MPARVSRKSLTLDDVRGLALALPEVEESTAYGATSFKARGKMIACQAINKSAEPNCLMVKIPCEARDELIAAEPDVYYVTDHYVNYPSVLVRLSRVHRDALRDLFDMALHFATDTAKRRARPRKSSPSMKARR